MEDLSENKFEIIRATETWQQAGAYYVRIQAMAKKHHITLRREFDEHDTPDTRYIVVTDDDFPVATARMYPLDEGAVMIGRVVVLPEYRHRGIGTRVVHECEKWAKEKGCTEFASDCELDNTVSLRFHLALGFEEANRVICFRKEL